MDQSRRAVLRGLTGMGVAAASVGTAGLSAARPTADDSGGYRPFGTTAVEGSKEAVVGPDGTTVYVATTDGFAIVDVSDPMRPTLLAERRDLLADHEDGPIDLVQDVKIDGDQLLVVGPAHGGRDHLLRGALLYDVSDPRDPQQLAVHETDFPIHNAFLKDGIAYLSGNNGADNPLVIVDMVAEDEPGGTAEIGTWSPYDHGDRWREVPARLRPLHDVWVQGTTAFLVYWDAGTWLVDIADPADPAFISRVGGRSLNALTAAEEQNRRQGVELPGNHHYAATDETGSLLAIGKEAWDIPDTEITGGPGGIDLWDIGEPTQPARLATIAPPPTDDPSFAGVWTTSHNFDLAGGRLYSSWYQGGVMLHDISKPTAPERLSWWRKPDEARFWTAQRARDCYIASDMGARGSTTGGTLYTFPDTAGTQSDPPTLGEETATPTPTRSPRVTASPSPSPSPTPLSVTETTGRSDDTDRTTTRGPGQPGFSWLGAALGVSGWLWWRRR
ncbi:MAG: LVIVD repeat-containing protein [Halobacteriales archaeon]